MRKINKLLLAMATSFSLISCSEKEPQDDLTINFDTDYGLYFYGDDTNDLKRYNENFNDEKYFSKIKPTILFFHGWQPGIDKNMTDIKFDFVTSEEAVKNNIEYLDYAKALKEEGYNVGLMWWAKYSDNLTSLFGKVWSHFEKESESISYKFAMEYAYCFKDYTHKVHFIGHSFGAQTSIATDYLLYKMKDNGELSSNVQLPSRLTFADPYIGDLALAGEENKHFLEDKIYHIDEDINGRCAAELVADVAAYLNSKGLVIDSYNAVSMVYDAFSTKDKDKKKEIYDKLYENTCRTILEGMQNKYGDSLLSGLHLLALDWVNLSLFHEVKNEDKYFPTAKLNDEEMRKLIGKQFKTKFEGIDIAKETFEEVDLKNI